MNARVCCVCLLVVLCSGSVGAETIIDANIGVDTVWTAAGSPYIVEKSTVSVRFGSTLTINPGVEVRFELGRVLTTDIGCSIVAVGTAADTIVFTSNSASPIPGDWSKVEVYASGGSAFEHCVFRYAKTGLYAIVSDPPVTYCRFRNCEKSIHCQQASPPITHCSFTGSTWVAIFCYGRLSVPVIEDCNFWNNLWNVYLQYYSGSEPEVTITAEQNWWGSDDEADIGASIYDKADNVGVNGVVDYDPWLSAQPVEATSWGRIKSLFRD